MGWLWASPPRSPSSSSSESKFEAPTSTSASTPDKPPKQPEGDYGDPEIAKFMAQLQAEFGTKTSPEPQATAPEARALQEQSPSASSPTSASQKTSLWSSIWGNGPSSQGPSQSSASTLPNSRPEANHLQDHRPPSPNWSSDRLDPVSESLLPTTMSCRQAFDAAFYCASMGGQFNTVYRYGTVRSCSDHWDDFWFCMRTRAYSGKMREEAIRNHYREREFAKYGPGRPSSNDVWEGREDKLPEGAAFRAAWEPPVQNDEEWRVNEIERRRSFLEKTDGQPTETET